MKMMRFIIIPKIIQCKKSLQITLNMKIGLADTWCIKGRKRCLCKNLIQKLFIYYSNTYFKYFFINICVYTLILLKGIFFQDFLATKRTISVCQRHMSWGYYERSNKIVHNTAGRILLKVEPYVIFF